MASEKNAVQKNFSIGRAILFLKEARGELRKVIWPNRKDTFTYTIVVCIAVVISTFFIWGVDIIFAKLIDLITK